MEDGFAIFTLGGSIDKTYSLRESAFVVGSPTVSQVLEEARFTPNFEIVEIVAKDSIELTEADRDRLAQAIESTPHRRVIVTHGTDTMKETAKTLRGISNKTVVITGAMRPSIFKDSDAPFNLGFAFAAAEFLPAGVYIAMNGRVFTAENVRKDMDRGTFTDQ